MLELLAGLVLSLTAAVVGAWQVTRRDRPLHGPLDDGTLGLPRLQRWDESYRPPRMQRLRSRFPRLELNRIVVAVAILLVVVGGGTFYYVRSHALTVSRMQAFELGLEQASARRQEALLTPDLATSYAMLIDARGDLTELVELHPEQSGDPRIMEQRVAIDAELERLTGATKLANVQTVGSVPAAPAGVSPRLVAGGGNVYLLTDAVYQLDITGGALVRLLSAGDIADGQAVETLRALSWRHDRLVAIDAKRSYAFDAPTGRWSVESLGTFDAAGFTDVGTAETYDYNLYLLAPGTGQILKFAAGLYDSNPEDWTGGMARTELKDAADMAIDGHVWVLLDNGHILNFFRSNLEETIIPQVAPPVDRASAIYTTAESPYLHVLSASDGRILRLNRDGTVVQQFATDDGAAPSPLAGATDLTIDETTGIAYILANDTIYTVRLPAGPAVETQQAPESP